MDTRHIYPFKLLYTIDGFYNLPHQVISITFNAPNHQGIGVTKEHILGGSERASYNALALSTVEHKVEVSAGLLAMISVDHYIYICIYIYTYVDAPASANICYTGNPLRRL